MSNDDTPDPKRPAPSVLDAMSHGRRGLVYGFLAGALSVILVGGALRHHEDRHHLGGGFSGGHHMDHHRHDGRGRRDGGHPWCEQMHERMLEHMRMMGAERPGYGEEHPMWPRDAGPEGGALERSMEELHEQMRQQMGHRRGNSVEGPQG